MVITHVGAYETVNAVEFELADLIETDSYVTGQDFYATTITVHNLGNKRLEGTLYHAGDCFLANEDIGYGAVNVPAAGSVACTLTPNDSPPAALHGLHADRRGRPGSGLHRERIHHRLV